MWILYVVLSLFIVFLLFFILLVKGFKNPVLKYETPENPGFEIQDIWIPAKNKKQLHAWYVPVDEKAPTIILVHGWGKNASKMSIYLKGLCCLGYNMLAFDARNHGLSDPDGYSSMLKFAEDITSAMDYVMAQPTANKREIYLIGLSIGGGAALYAASIDERIKKVVTVGAFAHPGDVMRKEITARHIPYFPLVWLFFKFLEIRLGFHLNDIAPVNNLYKSKAKILLIHGEKDKVVPFEQAEKLMAAAGMAKVRLWAIPNKGHSNCHLEPDFWNRINRFFTTD